MKNLLALLLLSISIFTANAQSFIQTTIGEPYAHPVDITRLKLEVSFQLAEGIVNGEVTHYFTALQNTDTLFLNGIDMQYEKVMYHGKELKYSATSTGITLRFPKTLKVGSKDSVYIQYQCTPRKGIYFIGWKPNQGGRKQIWTQGEGEDNRHWIPMYDGLNDKMITETIVHFPAAYEVLSNGTLISSTKDKKNPAMKIWHYRMQHPHSTYLIMLGIGEYKIEHRVTKSGVPVNLYYYPDQADRVGPTYKYATEAIDFMEQQTGIRYPWESYSQIPVQDFMYGAMENTTATIFGDFLQNDARGAIDNTYIGVDAHELTHQWFGDYVTGRSWKQIWLQESYATYYPKIFTRQLYGRDYYEWNRRNEHRAALSLAENNQLPIVHPGPGTARIYQKGSAVIDMLNYVYGEESWKRVIHYYLTHHPYSNVETNDLYQAFQDTLGVVPDWFFNEWLYNGGEPKYEVSHKQMVQMDGHYTTQFTVEQKQELKEGVGLFKMPIDVEVFYSDRSYDSVRVWVDEAREVFDIPNPKNKQVSFILFDPGSYILKKVTVKNTDEQWLNQVMLSPHMIDRYDAVLALRSAPLSFKRATYLAQLKAEHFHAVKVEIMNQLKGDTSRTTNEAFAFYMHDQYSEVRQAAIRNIDLSGPSLMKNIDLIESMCKDSSYVVISVALDRLQEVENVHSTIKVLQELRKEGVCGVGNSLRIKVLERLAANEKEFPACRDTLISLCSPAHEFQTRRNAAEALKRLKVLDSDLFVYLLEAKCSFNTRLSGPIDNVLKYYLDSTEGRRYVESVYRASKWTERERAILEPMFKR
ncbi:MAG: M1 family metallopeptidase [Chitinophagales bacterium]|nr:M1 family metallopeptidase [Chitinophagales bacterium]